MPNKEHGDNAKNGATRGSREAINPKTGLWVKKDSSTGKFTGTKENGTKFKGVRKEALEKLSPTLNRLAKYDKQ